VRLNRCGLRSGVRSGVRSVRLKSRVAAVAGVLVLAATVALLAGWNARVDKVAAAGNRPFVAPASVSQNGVPQTGKAEALLSHLPLIFEPNQGQADARVKFLTHGSGYSLFFTSDQAVLKIEHIERSHNRPVAHVAVVRMNLAGANTQAATAGVDRLPGKTNYFIGNNPALWHRNIPQFARVRYAQVYPGVDLMYYGNQGRLEYDFLVAPGADPQRIALHFEGASGVRLDEKGDLVLTTREGPVQFQSPRVYQTVAGKRRSIPARYELQGPEQVAFSLGAYDRSQALVIDPVLSFSTYLGGSGSEGCSAITGTVTAGCPAIALDSGSNIYVAGPTTSTDFPIPSGGTEPTLTGTANVFVTKFANSGTVLSYTTYIGGSGTDTTAGLAVDSGFDAFVAGTTTSTDFPNVNGLTVSSLSPGKHAFVAEVKPDGSGLAYSTYLAGSGTETASGLALNAKGQAFVTGVTTSPDYPVTLGSFQTTPKATTQFFLSEIDSTLPGASSLVYSTYFGGGYPSNGQAVGGGVAVDTTGNVYITGGTNFQHLGCAVNSPTCLDFPLINSYQGCLDSAPGVLNCPTNVTAMDAFVAEINPLAQPGNQLIYSTYLGGSGDDIGYGVSVDSSLSAYVTGSTNSTDFGFVPLSGSGVFQPCLDAPSNPGTCPTGVTATDAFVAKIGAPCMGTDCTSTSVTFAYFSYLGGTGNDVGLGIGADALGGAWVTGWTNSGDFHTLNAFQSSPGGATDAFLSRIDTGATSATATSHSSSYLGGSGNDRGTSIAVNPQNNPYVAGETTSANFPTKGPIQATLDGTSDAFVTNLGPVASLAMTAAASPSPAGVGSQVAFTYTITNNGDLTNGITFVDNLPSSGVDTVTASASPGSCSTPSSGVLTCSVGTLGTGSTAQVSVNIVPTVAGTLGNSASATVNGSSAPAVTAGASAKVNDFSISANPTSVTVLNGAAATYTVTVTPTGAIPESIALAVGSGVPSGGSTKFTTTPFPNLNNGPASTTLVVNTTERVTTTTRLWRHGGPMYALWLPVSGFAFLGLGGKTSRRRRILMSLVAGAFLVLILFQAGCGSTGTTTTTSGTPAGTYTLTIDATCNGTVSRTTTVQLIVQ
jgi:hypothetical protein